jgi:membrane protease subunit HflK
MAWNEPGGNRDPWSGSGRNQGPPDLDEVLKKITDRVRRLTGGRIGGGDGGSGGGGGFGGLWLIAAVLVVVWLLSGFYVVTEGKRAVLLRFGEYVTTATPGIHWRLPYPIEEVRMVDVASRRIVRIGYEPISGGRTRPILSEALMLTKDENIVNVQLAVQWQVSDPSRYLFTLLAPEQTLKEITESALREVVGKRVMDFVLTEGRAEVVESTRELIQETLNNYNAGVSVVEVVIQDVQPPEEVQGAFADAIRAREDEQRLINEARTYSNEILPQAAGQAARIREEAEGYRARVMAEAQGDAARFLSLLAEYQKAPGVTRERLYLETMEQVLGVTSKAMINVEGGAGGPVMYLPLDKLLDRGGQGAGQRSASPSASTSSSQNSNNAMPAENAGSDRLRNREVR